MLSSRSLQHCRYLCGRYRYCWITELTLIDWRQTDVQPHYTLPPSVASLPSSVNYSTVAELTSTGLFLM